MSQESEKIQLEDGYMRLANTIAINFQKLHLSGNEWQCLWVVINKTYGWNKNNDAISLTQFEKETGLHRFRINESLKSLVTKTVLIVQKKGRINIYAFNKLYFKNTSTENVTSHENRTMIVTKTVPILVTKTVHTQYIQDTITKDTITNVIEKPSVYGNQDINYLMKLFKEKFDLPVLDESEKVNRRYCYLAIKKFKGADKIGDLIGVASSDQFWRTKVTSFKKLYYSAVQIINSTRDRKFAVTKL